MPSLCCWSSSSNHQPSSSSSLPQQSRLSSQLLCCCCSRLLNRPKNSYQATEDSEDPEILRFWVPHRNLSINSVTSLDKRFPGLTENRSGSVTSASTLCDDENLSSRARKCRSFSDSSRAIRLTREVSITSTKSAKLPGERKHSLSLLRSVQCSLDHQNEDERSLMANLETTSSHETEELQDEARTSYEPTEYSIENDEASFGLISFSLCFEINKRRLAVYVDQITEMSMKNRKRSNDYVIKVSLLVQKSVNTVLCSCESYDKISHRTRNYQNPHFHQELYFPIDKLKSLKNRYLRLSLYESHRQGRFDALCHALFNLSTIKSADERYKFEQPLKSSAQPIKETGLALISMMYSPSPEKLTVALIRCRDLNISEFLQLRSMRRISIGKMWVYGKVTLLCGGEKIKSFRTTMIPVTSEDPLFNQRFHFILPVNFLEETSIVISFCIRGRFKQDDVIGRIISGPVTHYSGDLPTHWGNVVNECKPFTVWRKLRL